MGIILVFLLIVLAGLYLFEQYKKKGWQGLTFTKEKVIITLERFEAAIEDVENIPDSGLEEMLEQVDLGNPETYRRVELLVMENRPYFLSHLQVYQPMPPTG